MQAIRDAFYRPLSLTRTVVGSGMILFLTGICLLQAGATTADIRAARANLWWAGWVLTVGWVLKRVEDRQWPFQSPRAGPVSSSNRVRVNLLVVAAAAAGAMIWRSYGPLDRDYSATPSAAVGANASQIVP
jgi:hypothetical protein